MIGRQSVKRHGRKQHLPILVVVLQGSPQAGAPSAGRVGSTRAPTGRSFRVGGSPRVPQGGDGQRQRHRWLPGVLGPKLVETLVWTLPSFLGTSTEYASKRRTLCSSIRAKDSISATVSPLCRRTCRPAPGNGLLSDEELPLFPSQPCTATPPPRLAFKDACGDKGQPTMSHVCSHPATYQLRPPPDAVEQPAFCRIPSPPSSRENKGDQQMSLGCVSSGVPSTQRLSPRIDVMISPAPFDLVALAGGRDPGKKRNIKMGHPRRLVKVQDRAGVAVPLRIVDERINGFMHSSPHIDEEMCQYCPSCPSALPRYLVCTVTLEILPKDLGYP